MPGSPQTPGLSTAKGLGHSQRSTCGHACGTRRPHARALQLAMRGAVLVLTLSRSMAYKLDSRACNVPADWVVERGRHKELSILRVLYSRVLYHDTAPTLGPGRPGLHAACAVPPCRGASWRGGERAALGPQRAHVHGRPQRRRGLRPRMRSVTWSVTWTPEAAHAVGHMASRALLESCHSAKLSVLVKTVFTDDEK